MFSSLQNQDTKRLWKIFHMSFNKKFQSIGLFGRNHDYDLWSFNQSTVFHSFKWARALIGITTCIINLCLKWTFNSNDWKWIITIIKLPFHIWLIMVLILCITKVHVQKSSINTLCMLVNTLIEKHVSKIKFHLCIVYTRPYHTHSTTITCWFIILWEYIWKVAYTPIILHVPIVDSMSFVQQQDQP